MLRVAVGISIVGLSCISAFGQADQRRTFEVASIRPLGPLKIVASGDYTVSGGPGTGDPTTFRCHVMPLKAIVMMAYGLLSDRPPTLAALRSDLVSGPSWLSTEAYDIEAKVPPGTTKEQFHLMLQSLLADRFKLVLHRESRQVAGYEMTVAKEGTKLKESTDPNPVEGPVPRSTDRDGYPIVPPGLIAMQEAIGNGRRHLTATNVAIPALIEDIRMGHVVDKTGLTGRYNYHLETRRDEFIGGPSLNKAFGEAEGPGFQEALEKQLGLILKKATVPIEVLVVDQAEKVPTDN